MDRASLFQPCQSAQSTELQGSEMRLSRSDILNHILAYVNNQTLNKIVTKDTPLMDAGLDSLFAMQLCEELSQLTSLDLSPTLIFEYSTADALASFVDGSLSRLPVKVSHVAEAVFPSRPSQLMATKLVDELIEYAENVPSGRSIMQALALASIEVKVCNPEDVACDAMLLLCAWGEHNASQTMIADRANHGNSLARYFAAHAPAGRQEEWRTQGARRAWDEKVVAWIGYQGSTLQSVSEQIKIIKEWCYTSGRMCKQFCGQNGLSVQEEGANALINVCEFMDDL